MMRKIKKKREKEEEKEKENNEKTGKKKDENKKSKSEQSREKKKEVAPSKGKEVPYPLLPSRKDKERHLARFLDIFTCPSERPCSRCYFTLNF